LSVCSGIEAATVAWHQLGWEAAGFAEIEPFPAAVLAHHYPAVKNLGDMTNYKEWDLGTIDLLVGGTPCQSFSVAGLRKGLADPRGNLALVYCGILDHFRPKWCVWENVPGVLSSNGGRDFGSFLGALAELGYGFAYRVLDAQYFGVAQRRRRVFVVGYLGDWRPAAEVLFEPESVRGDPAPSREARQKVAGTLKGGSGSRGYPDPSDGNGGMLTIAMSSGQAGAEIRIDGGAPTLTCLHEAPIAAGALCKETFSGGMGGRPDSAAAAHVLPVAIQGNLIGRNAGGPNGVGASADGTMYTLTKADVHGVAQPTAAFKWNMGAKAHGIGYAEEQSPTFDTKPDSIAVMAQMAVRRLTPVECERLQGFPDGYTNIPWRKQPESPDGPRYKALGNSMAVPVMAWIGRRIAMYKIQQSRMVA
jgi:DNA (cytosine-5)-methyltransferase 1